MHVRTMRDDRGRDRTETNVSISDSLKGRVVSHSEPIHVIAIHSLVLDMLASTRLCHLCHLFTGTRAGGEGEEEQDR